MNIGYLGAFLGGALSLLSPCSALLVPAFFAYAFADRVRLLMRTGVFFLGLATTLVPMGVAAGSIGALFNEYRDLVVLIGGLLMIGLGIAQIVGFGFGSGAAQRLSGRIKISSALSVYLLGMVYGLAGFCAGPLLGSVLTMAMTGSTPVYGGILLALYSLGMALPLFVIAALWDRFDLGRRRWLRGREVRLGPLRVHSTTLIAGLVFIGLGILFVLTDGTGTLGSIVGIDAEFTAQQWVQNAAGAVSDQAVLLVIAMLVLIGLIAWRVWYSRRLNAQKQQTADQRSTERQTADQQTANRTDSAVEDHES